MIEPVNPKRSYDSPRRREQAAATRRDILAAAQRLFEEQGYSATTMAAIAKEAGVVLKTVYATFETKSGVLRALWNLLLRGDDADVPVMDRAWYREVLEEPDPERQLQLNARNARVVKTRIAGVLKVIRQRPSSTPRAPSCGRASSPTSTTTRGRSCESLDAKGALRPASMRRARATSSGRSTTPTCGSCSSASAAGRPSSGRPGSRRRRAPSCSRARAGP